MCTSTEILYSSTMYCISASDVSAEMDEVLVDSMELEWDDMEIEDQADDIVEQVPVVSVSETSSTNQHTSCPAHHQPSSQSSNSQ